LWNTNNKGAAEDRSNLLHTIEEVLSKNPRAQRKLVQTLRLVGPFKKLHKRNDLRVLLNKNHALKPPLGVTVRLQEVTLDDNAPNKPPSAFSEAMELYRRNFQGPEEPTEPQIIKSMQKGTYRLFILTKDDLLNGKKVAGMLIIAPVTEKIINLEYCAINDECQGRGLGTTMLKLLIQKLEQTFLKGLLTLECQKKLIGFYSRIGFIESGLRPNSCRMKDNSDKEIKEVQLHFMAISVGEVESSTISNQSAMLRIRSKLQSIQQGVIHTY